MFLKGAGISPHPPIIIPEIGRGEEKKSSATVEGMHKLGKFVQELEPKVIVLITPHGNVFSDGICILDYDHLQGDLKEFGYYDYHVEKKVSREFMVSFNSVLRNCDVPYIFIGAEDAKHYRIHGKLDHGCIVPLYYIDKYYQDYQIVHITIGMLTLKDMYRFGMFIKEAFEKCRLNGIIIASADLSHCLKDSGPYSFAKEGPVFDEILVDSIREKRYLDIVTMKSHIYEPAGQCGLRPIVMALGAMDGHKTSTEVYSYEGPFGVGYMTAGITVDEQSIPSVWNEIAKSFQESVNAKRSGEDGYIRLAREAINYWVTTGKEFNWEEYKKGLDDTEFIAEVENTRRGVFVSVHNVGRLRGCIGTISPVTPNAATEIIRNAIEACAFDSRFNQVEPEELEVIDIKVDVLSEAEKIDNINQLDVKKYGVIIKCGQRKGLLLPDLEGVDSAEEQIRIARQKAGILENEQVELFRFEVTRHEV